MYLIYINEVGKNWKGEYTYEFLFSNSTENVDGEYWDVIPSSGRPEPPNSELVKSVGKLITDIKFKLVQESDTFAMWDAVDGIVSLAWEDIDEYEQYPEVRLHFPFGMEKQAVIGRLQERDGILEFEKTKK
jgi:hypothetical protein